MSKTVRLFTVSALLMAGTFHASAQTSTNTAPLAVAHNTPSGAAGDAEATVCQHFAGSSQFNPEVCSHDHAWLELARDGKDPDGKPLIDRPTVEHPTGKGDPDDVTCRTPLRLSSLQSRVTRFGPTVCETNSFWADIIKNRKGIDARGEVVTPRRYGSTVGPPDLFRSPGGDNGNFGSSGMVVGNTPTFPGNAP